MNKSNIAGVTVTDSSTTWQHGHLKVIMRTFTADGRVERTIKAIDVRPQGGRGHGHQWEGSVGEFLTYAESIAQLSSIVKETRQDM